MKSLNVVSNRVKLNIQSLESLVRGSGVKLRNSGSGRLVGLCPFHKEKTPSFTIYPDGIFYCFGCGEHGDAIEFVRRFYGYNFQDALKHLGINRNSNGCRSPMKINRNHLDMIDQSRFESDLAFTLSCEIRWIEKAMEALTPENFDNYGDILQDLETLRYWHDILASGEEADRQLLLDDLRDYPIVERNSLFNRSFNMGAWLRQLGKSAYR